MTPTPYERVTYRPEGGRARTLLLAVTGEGALLLSGVEVTKDGVTRWTKGGTTSTLHVLDKALVTKRVPMRMDSYYGMLVEA